MLWVRVYGVEAEVDNSSPTSLLITSLLIKRRRFECRWMFGAMRSAVWFLVIQLLFVCYGTIAFAEQRRPNILFISMDDLNDWVGCLGGHPQSLTPNLDRLAETGVLFTNAHCVAPACNPSRSAVFTGRPPNQTGLYRNEQSMRAGDA